MALLGSRKTVNQQNTALKDTTNRPLFTEEEPVAYGEETYARSTKAIGPYTPEGARGQTLQHQQAASLHPRGSITMGEEGAGGYGTSPSRTTTATSMTKYTGTAPELGEMPTYTAPEEWSGEKMAGEVQKRSGLGLREARRNLRESVSGLGNDPLSAYTLRKALEQHGINVERTILGARETAEAAESAELARKTSEATMLYQAALQDRNQTFQAAWNKYLSTGRQVTTTTQQTGTGEGGTTGSGTALEEYRKTILRKYGLIS